MKAAEDMIIITYLLMQRAFVAAWALSRSRVIVVVEATDVEM